MPIVLLVFLLLVLVGIVSFSWVMSHTLNRIERVDRAEESWITPEEAAQQLAGMEETDEPIPAEDDGTPDGGEGDAAAKEDTVTPEDVAWTEPVERVTAPKVRNILLIGQDRRPGQTTRARSDVMVLCSLNEDTREIILTSFMRDMFVPFPEDYLASRMNHAFAWGGMSMLDTVIENDFGIAIDGNVVVDFESFVQVMSLIAPLDIDLKDYEAWSMNKGRNWGLRTGVNALNAEQLLVYVRTRHVGHGDWERTERQRNVLTKAFEKVRRLSLKELTDLADAALPYVSTDLSNADILGLLYTVFTNRMSIGGTYRIPADDTYSAETIYGMSVLVPDLKANSAYLQKVIYGK